MPQLCHGDACEMSKWTCQVGIPRAPCSWSQCLRDIFWHHFDISQASQSEPAHTWALDFPTQIFFPVFPIPVNDTAILIARDLQMSLVPLLYSLCKIDQCICGLFCSFQASPVPALIQSTNISYLVSFLLHPCYLGIHYPHNCQSDVCTSDHVTNLLKSTSSSL